VLRSAASYAHGAGNPPAARIEGDALSDDDLARRRLQIVTSRPPADADAASAMCDEWLRRSLRGDEGAFEALYRYLHAPLREYAESYVREPEVAEEIVQEVFLSVWRARAALRITRTAKGYFYIAVRNHALNHLKHGRIVRRSAERIAREESERVSVNVAVEGVERAELVAAVQRIAAQLPPRTRQAYTLYYEHNLSYAEVAEAMGIAVKTVEHQLARALRLISRGLEEEGL
jgi:RNA polymerase sigma-70 factor (ECF subfamily)